MRRPRRDTRGRVLIDTLFLRLREVLTAAPPAAIVTVAALSGAVETVFPPFPSEALLLLASFAAARHGLSPLPVILAAGLGSAVSLYLLYLAGRGPLRSPVRRRVHGWSAANDERAGRFFARWGYGALLVSRFLPAVRGPLTFLAGAYGLRPLPTAGVLLAGCLVWNALVVFIGWRTGDAWDGSRRGLLGVGLLLALAILVLWGAGLSIRWAMERGAGKGR